MEINKNYKTHPQVFLINGDYVIDDELSLFTVKDISKCYSMTNDVLYDSNGEDNFSHEQNLIIRENKSTLIMGCGNAVVVNILNKAKLYQPKVCIGGFHLYNPITKRGVSLTLLDEIAKELNNYNVIQFCTCHCTGERAFKYLSNKMKNLHYLSCGEIIDI